MSTPSSNKLTPPAGRSDKMKKQSRVIILKLSPLHLARFTSPLKREETKSSSSSRAASTSKIDMEEKPTSANDEIQSETNLTPPPSIDATASEQPVKKRKGPIPGSKRSAGQGVDNGIPKPRGKPGPKKKPRLDDGTIDYSAVTKPPGPDKVNGEGRQKLGPKANQGAINAGLRALDRSGKPVRKWVRKPFTVKSFTGVTWDLPSWKGGPKPVHQGIGSSNDSKDASQQSSSDVKPIDSSTAMDDSNAGDHEPLDPVTMSTPMAASSPIPAPPSLVANG